ncbi:fatty acid oxidation complex subunit alpha FadJ [Spiribacter halobius]|uniref:enoyl-CoA hydratase n=2 Tax=Sediminicurvatus halobius TaxID=2182432 RepID=A0A2U2MYH5_9GAMM|nr:fatty acid oxidation complex subunit alpha FadJ [Spiribacter halobius]
MTDRTGAQAPLTLERRHDGVAVIRIDTPGHRQNTLDRALIDAASRLLDELDADRGVRGLVFASGKPGSFIAGADIDMIRECPDAAAVSELARTGQRILARIAAFRVPVVAAIRGTCLGGGLELALACRARVASDEPATRLGLPEVQLGLLPGTGGTQRLPRLIGLPAALDLMLTGRQVDSRRALRLGLVDERVPASILEEAAARIALGDAPPRRRELRTQLVRWATTGNRLGRRLVLGQARKRTLAKTRGNYPAPPRILECVETGLAQGIETGLAAEAETFGELAMTPAARALIGLYFDSTAAKKDTGATGVREPKPVQRIGVLGGGLMGAGIATVSADRAGVSVRLKDVRPEGLGNAVRHLREHVAGRRRRRSLTDFEARLTERRLTTTLDWSGFRRLDVVIEAVFEDPELKHRMVAEVEANGGAETIFASNTSSLPIARIAEGAAHPERVVGMHYFSPVERMPLLEVIPHAGTAPEVVATAVAFGRAQGKTPIVVGDGAGFYVNRILAPYLNEAMRLAAEGVAIDRIDGVLLDFGFPVGPFKLLDEVGIDICAHVAPILHEAFGERMAPPAQAARMVEAGRLGRKSGRGFYRWQGRKAGREVDDSVYGVLGVRPGRTMGEEAIVDRTVLPMASEAVRCLDEGILRSARDGDLAAVFGIGFPPFRGGPFRYLDERGVATVAGRLQDLEANHGARFAPAPGLARRVSETRPFRSGEADEP